MDAQECRSRGSQKRGVVYVVLGLAAVLAGTLAGALTVSALSAGSASPKPLSAKAEAAAPVNPGATGMSSTDVWSDSARAAYAAMPERVKVAGPDGTIVGYASREEFAGPPSSNDESGAPIDRYHGNPGANVFDESGRHVGWFVPGVGFMTDEQVAAKVAAGEPIRPIPRYVDNGDGTGMWVFDGS